jgi:hypothetical protein
VIVRTLTVLAACLALLAGCAAGPRFDTKGVDRAVTPRQAAAEMPQVQGRRVLWGGVVVNSTNLAEATRIEVLAYPLDSAQEPNLDANPLGRFLVLKQGYLETADYSQGRRLGGSHPPLAKPGQAAEDPVSHRRRCDLWRLRTGQGHFSCPRIAFTPPRNRATPS